MKNLFKSTVYHLFHGHETFRDNTRFPIFNKHKAYKRDDWLEHIRRNYDWGKPQDNVDLTGYKDYINESLIYVYLNSPKPRITVCMVNYLRYDILIKNLENYIKLGVPINLILWINDSKSLKQNHKNKIMELCSKFYSHEIMYSKTNMGTGYPRFMMLNKAYHEYDTDYIMTTDDDIFFNTPEELVLGATVLDQEKYRDFGAVGLWCDPIYFKSTINTKTNTMNMDRPKDEGLFEVDALGAATMTIHRDVLSKCNCDPQYIIGLVDWDFCMSMRSVGYKLGLICDNKFKPVNNGEGNSDDYRAGRWDKSVIEKSKELFIKKWNIKIR